MGYTPSSPKTYTYHFAIVAAQNCCALQLNMQRSTCERCSWNSQEKPDWNQVSG